MMTTTDRIEKQITMKAPRSQVWKALTDSKEFGEWFQIRLDGPFAAGRTLSGRMTYKGYEHVTVDFAVDRIEPEHYFSYRWHPYAVDLKHDYSKEPMTLVEFTLEERDGGTLLRVTESGFEGIPIERRAEALKMNDGGWASQLKNIARYVDERAS